jgi:hypothetical protein
LAGERRKLDFANVSRLPGVPNSGEKCLFN